MCLGGCLHFYEGLFTCVPTHFKTKCVNRTSCMNFTRDTSGTAALQLKARGTFLSIFEHFVNVSRWEGTLPSDTWGVRVTAAMQCVLLVPYTHTHTQGLFPYLFNMPLSATSHDTVMHQTNEREGGSEQDTHPHLINQTCKLSNAKHSVLECNDLKSLNNCCVCR